MFGAIIGDIVGSRFEHFNHKSKEFELFNEKCHMTDDSMMTLAIMKTMLDNINDLTNLAKVREDVISNMVYFYKLNPNAGYGNMFSAWCKSDDHLELDSYGNGCAMRISPVGWASRNEEEIKNLVKVITKTTHNHIESIMASECIALSIYYLRQGKDKKFIHDFVVKNYYPRIKELNYESLVKNYTFFVRASYSVPEAIYCFLISNSFEDAIRTSISIGGDSDTICAICASLAEAYYGIDDNIIDEVKKIVDEKYLKLIEDFKSKVR